MAKPKLALIPAAYGTKFYSILPSDGVGDFDFSRGSVATRINPEGLIETITSGQSRLNYPLVNGVVKGCPHYLLEPSRTNLIPYSEDFTQWSFKTGVSVLSNEIISVDGNLNGSKIETTANGSRYVGNNYTLSTGDNTFSVFAKKGINNWIYLNVVKDGTNNWNYTFDLDNGLIGQSNSSAYSTTAKIEDYGNGWYRCSISANVTTAGVFTARIYCADRASDVSTIVGSNIYIYGAQLEEGSFATSYIPTNGTPVTRSVETANGAGDASTFNDSEGVLMAEISALSDDLINRRITISDNSTSNRIVLGFADASNTILALVGSSGTQFISTIAISDIKVNNKFALKYKQNDFALWINGFEAATDTSGNTPTGLSTLKIQGSTGFSNFYGKTKQLQYFDSALADTLLEQLTSWLSFRDMAEAQSYTIQ